VTLGCVFCSVLLVGLCVVLRFAKRPPDHARQLHVLLYSVIM
jgi:hypothetical protein